MGSSNADCNVTTLSLEEMSESIGGVALIEPSLMPANVVAPPSSPAFLDEYVWLPPSQPGQYGFVIDNFPFSGVSNGKPIENEFAPKPPAAK